MANTLLKASDDNEMPPVKTGRLLWSRTGSLFLVLLMLSGLIGAASLSETSTNYLDLAKILSVVAFIGSMLALAFGMLGDVFRA